MGLILDTSEFIAAERGGRKVMDVLARFRGEPELAISVVTLAELQHGVRRAQTARQRVMRQEFLEDVQQTLNVILVTRNIARLAGDLDARLEMRGAKVGLADLLIGSTALAMNYSIVTDNRRHFDRIDGLTILNSPPFS